MNKQLSYSGIVTKIRSMESNLLTSKDYENISYLTNVPEFIAYIKKKPTYAELFSNIDENTLHRGQIEQMLMSGTYHDFTKLYLFAGHDLRDFLSYYFKSYEITMIKKCLRLVFGHNNHTVQLPAFYDDFFKRHSSLNVPAMYEATSLEALTESLRDSEYYHIFTSLAALGDVSQFDYECRLDSYYFTQMWNAVKKKLPASISDGIIRLYGAKIDMLNLQWLHRGHFIYKLSKDKLISLIIPAGYKISKNDLTRLINCDSVEEYNTLCQNTYYFKKYHLKNISELDFLYNKIINNLCAKEAHKDPYSIATLYSYIVSKDYERKNLTRALECIRYSYEPAEIMKYIYGGN